MMYLLNNTEVLLKEKEDGVRDQPQRSYGEAGSANQKNTFIGRRHKKNLKIKIPQLMQTSLEYDANPLVVFISIALVNRGDIMYIIVQIYFIYL